MVISKEAKNIRWVITMMTFSMGKNRQIIKKQNQMQRCLSIRGNVKNTNCKPMNENGKKSFSEYGVCVYVCVHLAKENLKRI